MSYGRPYRGGGRKRGGRDDRWEHDAFETNETPDKRLRNDIIKLGEVDVAQETPRLAAQIRAEKSATVPAIAEAFRIGVSEQPFKIPFYAALLCHLYEPLEGVEGPSLGQQILDDFAKGFRAFLDKLAWREVRLCVHFFAHLTVAGIVSVSSMASLIQSFLAVLDELGVSHGRAKRAALCAAEGIMRAGTALQNDSGSANVSDMVAAMQTYVDSVSTSRSLVQPMVRLHSDSSDLENADEILDSALSTLRMLLASGFAEASDSYPQPLGATVTLVDGQTPFELPSILVPPDVEFDTGAGEEATGLVKKEEWSEYYLRLFDNDVTPDPTTPAGYAVRSGLLDIIDIYEVNRKECARILLEYPKWAPPGTFKPRPGAPVDEDAKPVPGKDWQLESAILEAILGAAFLLPEPGQGHKFLYYVALITELCKLSAPTIGPAVGRSIRKLYTSLQDGLDSEVAKRFAEWFAVHMSNFGFSWVWKEWIPDLNLASQHPKRLFIRRAVDFEIRLSYYDRVVKTLPEAYRDPDLNAIASQAPGPNFEYDEPGHPNYDAAQSILSDLRGRAKADDVMAHLETLRNNMLEASDSPPDVDAVLRRIAVQSLLHIGARSFSHFLNAIERYLPLLRALAAGTLSATTTPAPGGASPQAKAGILDAAAAFWAHNAQMVGIVFDKLMQYQIVDPTDVVRWTFEQGAGKTAKTLGGEEWDLLRGALDKANGRVVVAKRRVAALRKEEDDARARAKASGDAGMEVDEPKPEEDETPTIDSPALVTALKAFASLTREQKGALSTALDAFVGCLSDASANPFAAEVITENAWQNRTNWGDDEWSTWQTWVWYRHFCRLYSPYLRTYSNTLGTVSFAKLEASADPAAALLKNIWSVAILEA